MGLLTWVEDARAAGWLTLAALTLTLPLALAGVLDLAVRAGGGGMFARHAPRSHRPHHGRPHTEWRVATAAAHHPLQHRHRR